MRVKGRPPRSPTDPDRDVSCPSPEPVTNGRAARLSPSLAWDGMRAPISFWGCRQLRHRLLGSGTPGL